MTRKWAKVGVTLEANYLRIVDRATGAEFAGVVEVDADAGWLVRFVFDEHRSIVVDGDEARTERVEGLSLRIDIDVGHFEGDHGARWQEWNPSDTADGITELHKLPATPPQSEDAA